MQKDKQEVTPKVAIKPFLRALLFAAKLAYTVSPSLLFVRLFAQTISALLPLLMAFIVAQIVTSITQLPTHHSSVKTIILLLIASGAIAVAESAIGTISYFIEQKSRIDLDWQVNEQLITKYTTLSMAQRENKAIADLYERAKNFTSSAGWALDRGSHAFTSLITFIGGLVAIATIAPWLGLIVTIGLIPSFWIELKLSRQDRAYWVGNSVTRRLQYAYSDHLANAPMLAELKLYGLVQHFLKAWRAQVIKDKIGRLDVERRFMPLRLLMTTVDALVETGALVWIVYKIWTGALAIGQFVFFQSLISRVSGSGKSLLWSIQSADKDLLNTTDFYDFIHLTPEKHGKKTIDIASSPLIEFDNVSFTYPGSDNPTLKNINLRIEPGQDIALVGENGAGKTTLIKLLLGFYHPSEGQIRINNIPLEQLDPESWYKQIGVLFQDFVRYDFTSLQDNIWFGDITKKATRPSLQRALDQAHMTNLYKKLPHGYKQILSKHFDEKNGTDLSGGEWQRVALARNFFRNTNVLVLDEPTASVDAKAEYSIFKQIAETQKNKTTIIISHRFSTVRKAQIIYVIEGGQIIESGTHHDLMKVAGVYKDMFELQAEGYR
jgi:ATP-binding cassette subfamily B protein/ATP-binding cassette subfamily C protein